MQDLNFEKLTKRAIAIYTQERKALLDGNSVALEKAEQLKAALLADLRIAEEAVRLSQSSPIASENQEQLKSLHSIINRRTSELLKAIPP